MLKVAVFIFPTFDNVYTCYYWLSSNMSEARYEEQKAKVYAFQKLTWGVGT